MSCLSILFSIITVWNIATTFAASDSIYLKGHRVGQDIDNLYKVYDNGTMYPVTFNEWLNDLSRTNDSPSGNVTISKRDSEISCINDTCQHVDYHVSDKGVITIDIATYSTPAERDNSVSSNASYGLSKRETTYETFCKKKIYGMNVSGFCNAYDFAVPAFDFGSNVYTLVSGIIDKIKNTTKRDKTACLGYELDHVIIDPAVDWSIFVSTWKQGSANRDTQASADSLKCAAQKALDSEHNHQKTAFCIHLDSGGSFNLDIRLISELSFSKYNPWALSCPKDKGSNSWQVVSDCFE
ncbi:killer toxin [Saccharomyces pastorianus]|uniref:Killer toxin n=1 Tax=Saccharomyces pastorianus TaxID=27292 RepID=A0A6C1E3J8_SACPS|nr:killer toxin [Saccharomyces pastorianus]